jgi:hypothetical protein
MMAYIRLWRLCALHVECSRELTGKPWFSQHGCNGETIFDLPYCRIIFTPAGRLITGSRADEDSIEEFFGFAEGTAEN